MAVSDVSQKYDVIIRIFEILKYQNIPALTVWPIVPITFLILNNHQSGRRTAKISKSAQIAFFTFWSNVTMMPTLNSLHENLNFFVGKPSDDSCSVFSEMSAKLFKGFVIPIGSGRQQTLVLCSIITQLLPSSGNRELSRVLSTRFFFHHHMGLFHGKLD